MKIENGPDCSFCDWLLMWAFAFFVAVDRRRIENPHPSPLPWGGGTVAWLCRIVLAWLIFGSLGVSQARAAERYVAWLKDGTRATAKALTAWPLPGSSFRLDNRELLHG